MKTQAEILANLALFENTFGLPVAGAAQGSDAWFKTKLGVLSASNADKIVAKKDSEGRATYMAGLIAQVCTGLMPEFSSKETDWGNQHEDAARSSYEFETGLDIIELPFVFLDDKFREGCSPDGIVTVKKGVEFKCPFNSVNYVKFLTEGFVKSEWKWQNQFTLRVMNADEWDFAQFDPRMNKKPLHIITVERDEAKQKTLADAVPQFIHDMDKMLAEIGIEFGDQWRRISGLNKVS
jgi:hypothetical protein